eukprot:TRINITY_DN44154_c0_g1_i1.p1 TRINITY_DN44154_c0_g1~~TRINITY_DN44154_c0_g1_i1.p1  ORF type:complete len:655 (+),score=100.32 TRINITY_DN44154_c0_g1_i1:75-2039(+)
MRHLTAGRSSFLETGSPQGVMHPGLQYMKMGADPLRSKCALKFPYEENPFQHSSTLRQLSQELFELTEKFVEAHEAQVESLQACFRTPVLPQASETATTHYVLEVKEAKASGDGDCPPLSSYKSAAVAAAEPSPDKIGVESCVIGKRECADDLSQIEARVSFLDESPDDSAVNSSADGEGGGSGEDEPKRPAQEGLSRVISRIMSEKDPGCWSTPPDDTQARVDKSFAETLARCKAARRSSRRLSYTPGDVVHYHQKLLKQVTEHLAFDMFFGALIVVNAGFMAVETDWSLAHPDADTRPVWVKNGGLFFACVFCVELALRILAEGLNFFCKFQMWNYFDIVLVVMAVLEEVLAQAENLANMRLIRLMRLTRIAKVLRIARIVRLVSGLRTLISSLVGTLRQVVWAFFLIACLMFVFVVCVGQVVAEWLRQNPDAEGNDALIYHWGSVPRSMLTVYMAVTGGISWNECAAPLEWLGSVLFIAFLMYIALIQWVVLNVVTGTFCESAAAAARKDVAVAIQSYRENRDDFMKRAKCIFKSIDRHGTGQLSLSDMKPFLDQEPARALFGALDLDIGDVQELFLVLDEDETHLVDIEEFVIGCLRMRGAAKAVDVAKLHYDSRHLKARLYPWMERVTATLAKLDDSGPVRAVGSSSKG